MRHPESRGLQRDKADIPGTLKFWERILRMLRAHNLVSCQVDGRRIQYTRCGNVWRNIGENRSVYLFIMVFIIDLGKAYDRVPRHEVLRRKREKEVPDKYGMIVQNMYEGARTRAKTNDRMKSLDPSGRLYAVGQHQGYCIRVGMSMDVLACGIKYLSRGA